MENFEKDFVNKTIFVRDTITSKMVKNSWGGYTDLGEKINKIIRLMLTLERCRY